MFNLQLIRKIKIKKLFENTIMAIIIINQFIGMNKNKHPSKKWTYTNARYIFDILFRVFSIAYQTDMRDTYIKDQFVGPLLK